MRYVLLPLLLGARMALGQAVCTKSTFAVLRKGPGKQFEKSWIVPKYMPFMRVDQKNGWLKLTDVDGEIHWGSISDFTQSYKCIVIKSNSAETRQGPGTSFPYGEFKTLDRYTPLKRLDSKGDWVEVEDELGNVSWVRLSRTWRPIMVQTISF